MRNESAARRPIVSLDDIRTAAGQPAESIRVHQLRQPQLPEAYNEESQAHTQMLKKATAYAGVHGCSFAATILGLRYSVPEVNWRLVGLASAVPCGLAVGYVLLSACAIERKFYERERRREEWELSNFAEGEYAEMTAIYMAKGLSEDEAKHVVALLSRDADTFVDLMMVDELGYSCRPLPNNREALAAALVAVATFSSLALLPLMPRKMSTGVKVVGTAAAIVSVLQAKLLFGAYANFGDSLRSLRNNALWLVAVGSFAAAIGKLAARADAR
jgi:VIT1/CCC1 family predicted Fe2+/Mn2+ transporter